MTWLLLLVPVLAAVPLSYVVGAARAGGAGALSVRSPAASSVAATAVRATTTAPPSTGHGLFAEQAGLRRVATVVASGAPPAAVFSIVAAEVASLLGLETGLVVRHTDDGGQVVCWWGARGVRGGAAFDRWDAGGVAALRDAARPTRIDGVTATPAERTVLGPFRTCIAAPVHVGGSSWGALLAVTRSDRRVAPGAEDRLARFAELVSLAVVAAEARAAMEALGEEALRDHLTGLANRRTFERRLSGADRAAGRARAIGVVLMDLDLQPLADRPLEVADGVLTEVARRLTGLARRSDTLARIDGGRFGWLVTGGEVAALDAAERARHAVAAVPVPGAGPVRLWTGVAEVGADGDAVAAVERAHQACVAARRRARDRPRPDRGDAVVRGAEEQAA